MTAKEMNELLSRTGWLEVGDGFTIEVIIEDVRTRFGGVDVQVKPLEGRGLKWISFDRLKLI